MPVECETACLPPGHYIDPSLNFENLGLRDEIRPSPIYLPPRILDLPSAPQNRHTAHAADQQQKRRRFGNSHGLYGYDSVQPCRGGPVLRRLEFSIDGGAAILREPS